MSHNVKLYCQTPKIKEIKIGITKKEKRRRFSQKVSIHRDPVPPDGTSQSTQMSSAINSAWHKKKKFYLSFVGLLKCMSRNQRARGLCSAALVLEGTDIAMDHHSNSTVPHNLAQSTTETPCNN